MDISALYEPDEALQDYSSEHCTDGDGRKGGDGVGGTGKEGGHGFLEDLDEGKDHYLQWRRRVSYRGLGEKGKENLR